MAKKKPYKYTPADEIPITRSEPGLGCPASGCKWAGYTIEDRQKHITKKHPGEYAGMTPDMSVMVAAMRQRGHSTGQAGPRSPFEEKGIQEMGQRMYGDLYNDRRKNRG